MKIKVLNGSRESPFLPEFIPVFDPKVGADSLEVSFEYLAIVYIAQKTGAFIIVAVVVVARPGNNFHIVKQYFISMPCSG